MSHFTVLVIGFEPEEQLKPFQENNMGNCPSEFMEFEETEEDHHEEYLADNKGHESYEAYMCEVHGYEEHEGKVGYFSNPNSKWDWYQLGGRWTGHFKLKTDANPEFSIKGTAGIMTSGAKEGYADTALKKDIDITGMIAEAEVKAKERYEKVQALFPDGIPAIDIAWSTIIDAEGPYKDMDWDERRTIYREQESVKNWRKVTHDKADEFNNNSSGDERSFYIWLDQDEYQLSKEDYIKAAGMGSLSSYAVIKDGKWYERGEMGWWGMASNEKDENEWNKEFSQLIEELPDNTLLSLYDCHI